MAKAFKTLSVSNLKKKLDRIFSLYVRKRDLGLGCISCGAIVEWENWEAGHYYDRAISYASLYFDEQNVNGQCRDCNQFKGGNKQGYAQGLIRRYGQNILDSLERKKVYSRGEIWTASEYLTAIEKYKGCADAKV